MACAIRPTPARERRYPAHASRRSNLTHATYVEYAPPPGMASHACCVWINVAGADGHVQRVLPDGCADIVWVDGRLVVAGPATKPVVAGIEPGSLVAGVRFGPGAAGAALGVSARGLRDRTVELEALWGRPAAQLAERLAQAPSAARQLLAAALAPRLREAAEPPRLVAPAAEALGGGVTVAAAGRVVALGERQLRRRFHEVVGYGPKTLQRVLRLRRFLDLADSGADLARAAVEAGYSDQPHLSRECAELAGLTPAALLDPSVV